MVGFLSDEGYRHKPAPVLRHGLAVAAQRGAVTLALAASPAVTLTGTVNRDSRRGARGKRALAVAPKVERDEKSRSGHHTPRRQTNRHQCPTSTRSDRKAGTLFHYTATASTFASTTVPSKAPWD